MIRWRGNSVDGWMGRWMDGWSRRCTDMMGILLDPVSTSVYDKYEIYTF